MILKRHFLSVYLLSQQLSSVLGTETLTILKIHFLSVFWAVLHQNVKHFLTQAVVEGITLVKV